MSYPFSRRTFGPLLRPRITSITGLENIPRTGPVLFVANHVGDHDPLLLGAAIILHTGGRKIHTVTKWKILWCPLWRKWMGIIPLYPDRTKTFSRLEELIRRREMVLIYPEGGVNVKPVIDHVKTGAARLALTTRVPIIPVGLQRATPPPKTELGFVLEILYARLRIQFGPPLDLAPWFGRTIDAALLKEVNSKIMTTVANLANKTYEPQ